MTGGPLFLVGGNEFRAGNEPHDLRFAEATGDGPAYVVASAAARQDPDQAVFTAIRWFGGLGLRFEELPLRTRRQANDPKIAAAAADGRGFYLCGGDPGLVVTTLRDSVAWQAIVAAWRGGAALAGSSAAAMAMGEWTLLRAMRPGDRLRRYAPALDLVPNLVVVPHLDEFGDGWIPSTLDGRPDPATVIVGIDARTAAVWWPGRGRGWSATGVGAVEVLIGNSRRRVAAGHRLTGLPRPSPLRRRGT